MKTAYRPLWIIVFISSIIFGCTSHIRQMKSYEGNILSYVETEVSAKELSWYPLFETQCQIGKVMFRIDGYPVDVLYSGNEVLIETNVKDNYKFKFIVDQLKKRFKLSGKKIKDQGARLSFRASLKKAATYSSIVNDVFEYYNPTFSDVRLLISCRDMPRWAARWFAPGWKTILEKSAEKKEGKK